jgi:HPt (histidine-containing phosphotransfer) domain-containing protein
MSRSESHLEAGSVLDYAEAVQRLDGQPDLFGMVAAVFLEDYPSSLAAIRDALTAGDAEALAFSAHKFKGALSALSAYPARAVALRLEEFGRAGDLQAAQQLFPALVERVNLLVPVLNDLIPPSCG